MNSPCIFTLNNSSKCICKTACHNSWSFGIRWMKDDSEYLFFDDVNSINKYNTNEDGYCRDYYMSNEHMTEQYNTENKYVINCYCSYCTYAKNKHLNNYNECFCCKKKLYVKNVDIHNDFIRCSDCNSILCVNCVVQGRYQDEDAMYCFDCRKFLIHKNQRFYFNRDIIPYDDWMDASWYY